MSHLSVPLDPPFFPLLHCSWTPQLLSGEYKDGAPPSGFGVVDVRDVARAHVEAMERPEASGRYICSSLEGKTTLDHANALREDASLAAYHDVLPAKLVSPVETNGAHR